jgi:hypothetical protein
MSRPAARLSVADVVKAGLILEEIFGDTDIRVPEALGALTGAGLLASPVPKPAGPALRGHCCTNMALAVGYTCDDHPGEQVWQCPDFLVAYNASHDLYGLVIHDGGGSFMEIVYCPWCGARLPEGKALPDGDG